MINGFEYRRFVDAFHAIHKHFDELQKQLRETEKAIHSLAAALIAAKHARNPEELKCKSE